MNDLHTFPDFEEIPHKADAAITVYGCSLPELFSHAALGMYHILGISGKNLREVEDAIVLQAPDHETMLVSFLTELLYLAERGIKVEISELEINNNILNAKIYKSPFHGFSIVIKAVTFNEMKIMEKDEIFQTRIVFDI
jgi:SHS2 domain-containing protein